MASTPDLSGVAKRGYWRQADAQVVVAAWQASGEGLSAFARRYGLDRRRIGRWARRLDARAPVGFHPVRVTDRAPDAMTTATPIEIDLEAGVRLRLPRGFDVEDLRRVLAVFRDTQPC